MKATAGATAVQQDGTIDFTPGPDTAGLMRQALGRFVTGVTVVTVPTSDGPMAIAANSFTSVSLDPPLVLWCPSRTSRRFVHFADAPHFSIHVMGREQFPLVRHFATGSGRCPIPSRGSTARCMPRMTAATT
jgi:flavin reductase (DIM6/NTAB) family NADH-FMN oxidoreductase RutF